MTGDLDLRETAQGIEVRVHVQPRARRMEIAGTHDRALKLKVAAPPVDDAANRAVVEFLASVLGIAKSSITIAAGAKSRNKTLAIRGLSPAQFLARLGAP
ncbi:MAG: DUF167 domain-containing protein [Acidobacteriota bacterium]|jgi:uncharacterized protein (TIGR00251 family)|nr:DUF167 domain-containing protein [Acidobacteriota bacterium]NLT33244.1 DUF167 domain-containing protein [Acidobacteriota bacterium]